MNQSDLKDKVKLNYIGTCPVCGKGRMLQGSAGWTCNHFHDWEDMCSFTIFGSYNGYALTEEDAVCLITVGETGQCTFISQRGKPFTGKLMLVDDKVRMVPDNKVLDVPCPLCGGKIREVQGGWMCERYTMDDVTHCPLYLPKLILGRTVTEEEALQLLDKGRTDVLDSFVAKGKPFSSCLVIDNTKGWRIDGRICTCPKCGGDVYAGKKAYNCSNNTNKDVQCDFVIWRSINFHKVTPQEVELLCSGGRTGLLDFMTKSGKHMSRSMMLDDHFNVKLI